MIAAPRLATVGMKVFSTQSWSPTTSAALRPPISAWKTSGYCVAEWLPQIVIFLMSVTGGTGLGGQLRDRPVVVEPGERREPLARDVGGVVHRDQRVGVGRVAGHADAYVVGRDRVQRLALRGEDGAVRGEQVAALHARSARAGADEERQVDAVEDLLGVVADLDAGQLRERAVVELHDDALERLQRRGDLQQAQLDRAVAGQRAARETEQQAVADLAGCAGDGHLQRGCAHGDSSSCGQWARPTLAAPRGPATMGSWRTTRPPSRGPDRARRPRPRGVRQRLRPEPAGGCRRPGDPDAVGRSRRLRHRRRQPLAAAPVGRHLGVRRHRRQAGTATVTTLEGPDVDGRRTTAVQTETRRRRAVDTCHRLLRPGRGRQRLVVRPARASGWPGGRRRRGGAGHGRPTRGWATATGRPRPRGWSTGARGARCSTAIAPCPTGAFDDLLTIAVTSPLTGRRPAALLRRGDRPRRPGRPSRVSPRCSEGSSRTTSPSG